MLPVPVPEIFLGSLAALAELLASTKVARISPAARPAPRAKLHACTQGKNPDPGMMPGGWRVA